MFLSEAFVSEFLEILLPHPNGQMKIEIPAERRPGNGKSLWLRGAKGNNLKNVDVEMQRLLVQARALAFGADIGLGKHGYQRTV